MLYMHRYGVLLSVLDTRADASVLFDLSLGFIMTFATEYKAT